MNRIPKDFHNLSSEKLEYSPLNPMIQMNNLILEGRNKIPRIVNDIVGERNPARKPPGMYKTVQIMG